MKISEEKIKRIKEEILSLLFHNSPNAVFTAFIARELARDEEFVKNLLEELGKQGLIMPVHKSPKGMNYRRRIRWRLTDKTYEAYKGLEGKKL